MKKIFMAILTAVFLMPSAVWGEIVTLGNGTAKDANCPIALGSGVYNSITQQLYLSSEIGTPSSTTLTKISFYYNGSATYTRDIEVYIAQSTNKMLASSTGENWMFYISSTDHSAGTKVFDGSVTLPSAAGWYDIEFDTAIEWDKAKNIIVTINDKSKSGTAMLKYHRVYTPDSNARGFYKTNNSSAISFDATNTYDIKGNATTSIPQIKFHFEAATSIPVPQNLEYDENELTNNSAKIVWEAVEDADSYTIRYKENGTSEYTEISNITNTYYTLSDLAIRTKYFVAVKAIVGSSASDYSEDINFTTHSEPLTIDDQTDDYSVYEGNTYYLTVNRTLTSESYNTICLPFAMSSTQCKAAFGDEFNALLTLSSASIDRNYLVLNFHEEFNISAGKPYLVKPATNITSWNVEGAIINTTLQPTKTEVVNFIGVLTPTNVAASKANLFLGADNTLYYNESAGTLKGMRAYFQVIEPSAVGAPARIRTANETTTGIESTFDAERAQKLLNEGRVIIRIDGHDYDLNGTMIR